MNPNKDQMPKGEKSHMGVMWDGKHQGPRDTCSKCNDLVGKMFGKSPKDKK